MSYFILMNGEDGASIKGPLTKEQLTRFVNDEENSGIKFIDFVPLYDGWCWCNAPDNAALIIRGDIIVPRPVKVVEKLEVD